MTTERPGVLRAAIDASIARIYNRNGHFAAVSRMCHQITDDEKISRTLFEIRSGVCGMHGRIVTVHVDPADIDEAVEVYEASVVPAAKSQAGFHGAMLFVDHATGRGVSVTFWESEELMMQGQGSQYYSDQIAKFAALLTRAPEQHGYELVTREIAF